MFIYITLDIDIYIIYIHIRSKYYVFFKSSMQILEKIIKNQSNLIFNKNKKRNERKRTKAPHSSIK